MLTVAVGSLLLATAPVVASDDFPVAIQWKALAACPRIVATTAGFGTATGVTVGVKDGLAYVLTATHTVAAVADREAQFFAPLGYGQPAKTYRNVTAFHEWAASDVAVLQVPVGNDRVPVLKLAAPGKRPKTFPVPTLTVGCTNGGPPTCATDTLRAKRFERRPTGEAFFWETTVPPSAGRSGGPLLDSTGAVIGICAANRDGRGYYAHLDEIHAALTRAKMTWLWE